MENFLEQEESIAFLQKIVVVPQKAYAKILDENGTRFVLRQYKIKEIKGYEYDTINISYAFNIDTDTIEFYSVYLTSEKNDDILCLCKTKDSIYNSLFDNILLLEDEVWKRHLKEEVRKDVNNFKIRALMFQVDNKHYSLLLDSIYETKTYQALLSEFYNYVNSSQVVPQNFWENFLNDLTKLSTI